MGKKRVSEVNKKVDADNQAELVKVSNQIQEILESNGFAIQPYLDPREFVYGIVPKVRLVKVNNPTSDDQRDTAEASEGSGTEDGAASTEQS